jgi:outer membrane protein insertion porin family
MPLAAGMALAAAVTAGAAAVSPPAVVSLAVEGTGADVSRYLAIERGAPLDPARVRRTVELLHATGAYEDVVVLADDVAGGVAVTVRLVPAPLLAGVAVDGHAVVTAEEARRVTRLRDGEPLWSDRLERAARDLALALGRQGRLEARVTAAARREEGGGATAIFTVAAGPEVRVASTAVETGERSLDTMLADDVEPDAGETFDRERARAAAEKMRAALAARGRWRAAVEVEEAYDPASGTIRLVFRAQPGPVVSARFHGVEVPRAVTDRVRAVLREGAAGTDAIEEGRDLIEAALRESGHRRAEVTPSVEEGPGRADVVYAIDPGPRSEAASVTVMVEPAGAMAAPAVVLRTRAGRPLRDDELAEDERALARAAEDEGHASARVRVEAEGEGPVAVVFRVAPGPRTVVAAVEVAAPEPRPEAAARELRVRAGSPYRVRDVAADRDALVATYRNAGHLSAEARPEVALSPEGTEARVRFVVAPGPRTMVDRVVVAGLDRTREAVVRRELQVREGEPLGADDVLETRRRLAALGLFQAVNVVELAGESPERRTLVIRVDEGPRTSVSYGIGYGERDLLRGSVEVTRRNLFGMDRRLSAFVRMSFRGSRLLASFREPYLFGRRQELFVTAFRDEEDREAFDYARYGITVQTARAVDRRWNVVLRQTYQEIRTYNVIEDCLALDRQFCPATVSGPSASLVGDTRDDPLDPRRGFFLLADAQLSHRWLGGDALVKGFLHASAYRRLVPRTVLALSGRVGLGRTFGEEPLLLPVPERFFAGGDYSLRGFGVDDVRVEGGNGLLLGTAEVRVDVGGGISTAAFADAGNVYRLASDVTLRDLRYAAGVGLRYRSALGPLRVDWGFKLDRREDESASHLHVTIGHAF